MKDIIDAGDGRLVRSWASLIDDKTLEQAKVLARHPNITQPVALMPDAHLGIGATVGSVALCEGGIIPSIVGVDIGCGVTMIKMPLSWNTPTQEERARGAFGIRYVPSKVTEAMFKQVSAAMRELIPSGVGQGHTTDQDEIDTLIPPARSERIAALWDKAREQFGTLGAGNHFAELSYTTLSEKLWGGTDIENRHLRVLIHSGSRGVGNMLAQQYIAAAKELYPYVPAPDLACIPEGTSLFNDYITDMLWAQDYAYMSRLMMATRIQKAIYEFTDTKAGRRTESELVSCHHNYAVRYTDRLSGVTGWLSRKGAIDASDGTKGIIPGSMGTATYVVRGRGNELAYDSAPHGAGRLFSRGEARRTLSPDAFRAMMAGRVWQDRDAEKLIDEAPDAYKDITQVMADAKDLVTVSETLQAVVNYKGL